MSTRWLPSPITPSPAPRPNSAVTIGRPIASNEPKLSSSTTTAARRPTPRCEADARLLGLLDCLPAELDLKGGRTHRLGRVDHAVDRRLRQFVRALVELDGREADRARLRDGVRAGLIGTHDADDVGEPLDPVDERHDHGARRLVGELAGARSEDDLVRVAGLRRKAALQQVDRALRVGVRKREVVRVPLADRLGEGENADGKDDPGENDDPAMCDRPASQLQHRGAPIRTGTFMLGKIARRAETSRELHGTQIFAKCRIYAYTDRG